MTARLILARHGNTFRPEDEPVWVGARSDLPLVEKGLEQAEILAQALQKAHITLDAIISGPLQRTRQAAQIVAGTLQIPAGRIRIDTRLKEIDYGAWEGKSTAAIIALGGGDELAAWNRHGIFPADAGWQPHAIQIFADTAALLEETTRGTTLIVTSNGILRFFSRAALNTGDFPDRKVATGHICIMERDENGDWRILQWNMPPELLSPRISP